MEHPVAKICLIVLVGIVLRCAISLHPYSGQGKLPMHGDFEAQRHWMEITYHLSPSQWYVNTSDNDLQYWGLDYPPLTAYHSWLLGAISHRINTSWVELNTSRGHESYAQKVFMRHSVLVADLVTYIPAVVCYYLTCISQQQSSSVPLIATLLALVYPGLMLIDHGHFQYNCISLGLTVWAVIGLARGHDLLGSLAFTLAINYKQMSLYHALPFFTYLLGTCLQAGSYLTGLQKLLKLGVVVIVVFVVCWLPFLYQVDLLLQVVHRLFPFARGLFEDKVANIWCSLSVFVKLKQIFELPLLVRISLVCTLLASLPSSFHLFLRPSIAAFKYALVNSALVFFLFSFQVHEKSILLVALPVCLLIPSHPLLCVWFLMVTTFSMLPLLVKDGLIIAYLASMVIFYLVADLFLSDTFMSASPRPTSDVSVSDKVHVTVADVSVTRLHDNRSLSLLFWLSCSGMSVLTVAMLLVAPPSRLPDLHSVLVCIYSCVHFVVFLVVFHWLQLTVVSKRLEHGTTANRVKKFKSH